jgi:hypothetical protein
VYGRVRAPAARASPLRTARRRLRPRRRRALVRSGSALAAGARRARAERRRLRARRDGHRPVAGVSSPAGTGDRPDQSPDMLAAARRASTAGCSSSRASRRPSVPGRLLRPPHVHIPPPLRRQARSHPRRSARVVRPGGTVASLEFSVPAGSGVPLLGPLRRRQAGGESHLARVARGRRFLGPSIRGYPRVAARHQLELWRAAGIVLARRMSLEEAS